jgi:predicted nucleic acid-binding protein
MPIRYLLDTNILSDLLRNPFRSLAIAGLLTVSLAAPT